MEAGALAGAEEAAAEGINVFGDAEEWDVLEEIPRVARRTGRRTARRVSRRR